ADAELAELYKACPLAAVIDLQTVATSPEKIDAILPPYRELADHVPNASADAPMPRIQYPVHVGAATSSPGPRIASNSHAAAKAAAGDGQWLIDPKEWLGSGETGAETAASPPATPSSETKSDSQNATPSAPSVEKSSSVSQPAKTEPTGSSKTG